MTSTALARLKDEPTAVDFLTQQSEAIAPFLPKGVNLARVILTVRLAIRKNPKLLECSPDSIVNAIAQIQQWGLEIGTTAHLVPFKTNVGTKERPQWLSICTPIADYTGLAELVVGSGAVRHCEARCVYANEPFVYEQGLSPKLEHHPVRDAKDRGPMVGAYVIFRLAFNNVAFEFYPIADIEFIRQTYSKQWKQGPMPAWYAKKTAVRQGVKLIPKNPRLASALRTIEQEEALEREGEFEVIDQELRPTSEDAAVIQPTGAATPPSAAPNDAAPAKLESREDLHRAENTKKEGPAPTSAPNTSKVITPTSITDEDLAWAAKVRLLGKPEKWGGNGGKVMGELPTSLLEQVRDFFAKKRAEEAAPNERLDTQIRAASIILADRERAQGTLDLEDESLPDELPAALTDEKDDGLPF